MLPDSTCKFLARRHGGARLGFCYRETHECVPSAMHFPSALGKAMHFPSALGKLGSIGRT